VIKKPGGFLITHKLSYAQFMPNGLLLFFHRNNWMNYETHKSYQKGHEGLFSVIKLSYAQYWQVNEKYRSRLIQTGRLPLMQGHHSIVY